MFLTQKVRKQDMFRREWSQPENTCRSNSERRPIARRSKRHLLVCRTLTSRNLVINTSYSVIMFRLEPRSQTGVMSDQWILLLRMVIIQNVMLHLGEGTSYH